MRRLVALLVVTMAIMAVPLLQTGSMWLESRSEDGRVASCIRVSAGDEFTLEFTHSMFGGYVRETWRVTPNGELERIRFVTENPAAAEYYATEVTSTEVADGWEVPLEPFTQQSLVVRVNQRGKHQLHLQGTTAPLHLLIPGSNQVHIKVTESSCQSEESD